MKLDRTIPYFNILMCCSEPKPFAALLPEGYRFRFFAHGDERRWAEIEADIGDFAGVSEAEDYFVQKYLPQAAELSRRCLFLEAPDGETVGSCIAWRDKKGSGTVASDAVAGNTVASLHWLAVKEKEQGRGLGKALLKQTLEIYKELDEFPVYLHTQPWSYTAVSLYLKAGFCLLKSGGFADYQNQNREALAVLRQYLPAEMIVRLQNDLQ